MEKLALVRPSLGYSDRIEEFRARIKQADSAVLLTGGLNALSVPEWLKLIQKIPGRKPARRVWCRKAPFFVSGKRMTPWSE